MKRFDVYLVRLDPTVGSEIQKTRPCVIVSPDVMNHLMATMIVAPMSTHGHSYAFRVACQFKGKSALVILDQLRTVDKSRLLRHMGRIDETTQQDVLRVLAAIFTE